MVHAKQTTRFRFWLWLIQLFGVIVPQRLRCDWRQEWEAELRHREMLLAEWDRLNWRSKFDLLRRSTSAFWDALWMQTYRWEDAMIQDLRYGVRMLLKHRIMTLIAIFTLALGIGANTAIFSVVNAVLLNAVPYYEPHRLVWVTEVQEGRDAVFGTGVESYLNWQAQSQTFEHLVAFNESRHHLTGRGEPEDLESLEVTSNVFPALGRTPLLGRAFTPEEDRPAAAGVVVLSHAFWQRRFGGDRAIIGQTLTLNGESRTVIGIMPPRSQSLLGRILERADVWVPIAINEKEERNFSVIGRVKVGFTPQQAHEELNLIQRRLVLANPGRIMNTEARATPLGEKLAGNLKRGLLVLFGAVGLVLLIACANVANLLLGRGAMRQKEMAVRAAVGAGRLRLVRQMLTESLLLSLLGGVIGLLSAVWGVKALVALAPDDLNQIRESSVDGTVLGFTFLATLLTGLVAGLIPALQSSQIDLNETLKEGSRRVGLRRRWLGRFSPGLVIGEVALTLVVLTGAGLLVKSYLRVLAVDPGYDPKNLLMTGVRLDEEKYDLGSPQAQAFYQEVLTRLKTIPGVKAVAGATVGIPMTGAMCHKLLIIDGRPPVPAEQRPQVECSQVSSDYIQAMGMQMRAGRSFTEQDDEKAPPVGIINEALARRYFTGEDPIGKRLDDGGNGRWTTIVGVVRDVKRFGLEAEAQPELYTLYAQRKGGPSRGLFLAVRTSGNPPDSVAAVSRQLKELGVTEPMREVKTMEQLLAEPLAPRRFPNVVVWHLCRRRLGPCRHRRIRGHCLFGQPADARDRDSDGAWRRSASCVDAGCQAGDDAGDHRRSHRAGRSFSVDACDEEFAL